MSICTESNSFSKHMSVGTVTALHYEVAKHKRMQ